MDQPDKKGSLESGATAIRKAALALPETPGVYRMLGERGEVLYVGKARALKRRVLSYTKADKLPVRLQRMVARTVTMEFVHTATEIEALLLEANLIKKLKPVYNILLRDDKSFPYILLSGDHSFPRLVKHRGARTGKGRYFGPFAGGHDVNRVLILLQKAFLLRNCTDSAFSGRDRPCLQYHIKRCTAPCVGRVSEDDYAAQVEEAAGFLSGKSREVQDHLSRHMLEASERLDYEEAARLRDRIRALTAIQARQIVNVEGIKDADAIGLAREGEYSCVQVFFFRGGQNFGNRSWYLKHDLDVTSEVVLANFIAQFYENKPVPAALLVSVLPEEAPLIAEALSERAGRKVTVTLPRRGTRRDLVEFAARNARDALARHVAEKDTDAAALRRVAELFELDDVPGRIEVYDNSHISGTNMVGAMIVAGPGGFDKNGYRKFNIRKAQAGDDYGMMREVFERRFGKAAREDPEREGEGWPDLVLIDGGQGQLNAVTDVLAELGLADSLCYVAISKGPDRHAGREFFHMPGRKAFQLPVGDPVLHYLQRIRDEAHRFAVGAHRTRRKGDIARSPLDEIPGIGARRKKALLMHFGSARAVADAGLKDLAAVEGISAATAETIYNFFHRI
ncbi:MAG: excinuclease ABC subunit UvrC [Alphaproteobacteria bacterium]|nr:excinuclease ABC subunit UvrC [Alphaproteobacteria bacterium]